MFGRRADAVAASGLSSTRRFMPFISPGRNDSLVYYTTEIAVDEALRFVDAHNRARPPERRVTLFHLYLRAVSLALHERPVISRVVSMDHPTEIKEGMVFAIETYCPATDGFSGARIEEEVVVTDKGCRVISLFPAEELPIANRY